MCGRYVLLRPDIQELLKRLHLEELYSLVVTESRYNIGPGQKILAVRDKPEAKERDVAWMNWGFRVPASDAPGRTNFLVNARGETLTQRPTFRAAARERRCLVPASGFYEWKRGGPRPEAWLFRLRDNQPFFLAGIWEPATEPEGHPSVILVTTTPNALMQTVHDRMPVMLQPEKAEQWVGAAPLEKTKLREMLEPLPADALQAERVSDFVNNIRNEGEGCWAAPLPVAHKPVVEQLDFGL